MAATTPDNLYSPDDGDGYALVQDMGLGQDTVQAALVRRANLYVGTVAQRNAFTATAPEGVHWQDTDGATKFLWVKQGATWQQSVPLASGGETGLTLPANSATNFDVALPVGRFATTPRVVIASNCPVAWEPQPKFRVLSRSTTSFTVQAHSTTARTGVAFDWIATNIA